MRITFCQGVAEEVLVVSAALGEDRPARDLVRTGRMPIPQNWSADGLEEPIPQAENWSIVERASTPFLTLVQNVRSNSQNFQFYRNYEIFDN
jgi:hypothetical protein